MTGASLEFYSRADLYGTWRADSSSPSAETICPSGSNIVHKGKARALVVNIGGGVEVMAVEGVKEGKPKLEVSSFSDGSVLSYREVQVLATRASQVRDAWTVASIPISSGATRGGTCNAEVAKRLECSCVQ